MSASTLRSVIAVAATLASVAEDRLAEMRVYGGTNTFHISSGWVQFYT